MSGEAWLTVVGCLPSGALAPGAPAGCLEAEAVFGPARLLSGAGVVPERAHPWPRPFADGIAALLARRGRPTTVLASGDPFHFGVAATLARDLPAAEMRVYPAPSAFSLAAACMRWPLEGVAQISLHTGPPEAILATAATSRRILALTRDGDTPGQVADLLAANGFGASPLSVLQALGGPDEAAHHATAATLRGTFHPLNVLAIECRGDARPAPTDPRPGPNPGLLPNLDPRPGFDPRPGPIRVDDLTHDGCVTRDEVRLLTIAALGGPGHLWDVGAGSGAVAIDWCRAGGTATLVERVATRAASIRANLAATGVVAEVREGTAPEALAGAAAPTHVFLGGGVADTALFDAVWGALPSGGVCVSNAVTLAGEVATFARYAAHGGNLTRIALSHGTSIGRQAAMKPAMPVLQWRGVKP